MIYLFILFIKIKNFINNKITSNKIFLLLDFRNLFQLINNLKLFFICEL